MRTAGPHGAPSGASDPMPAPEGRGELGYLRVAPALLGQRGELQGSGVDWWVRCSFSSPRPYGGARGTMRPVRS